MSTTQNKHELNPGKCVCTGSPAGRFEFSFETLAEASAKWIEFRDRENLSGSDCGYCRIYQGGKVTGYVSFNGRVWAGNNKNVGNMGFLLYTP